MTALLAVAGTVLLAAAIVAPVSLLWIPGGLLLGTAWWRFDTRHVRAAQRRRDARGGWIT